MSYMLHLDYLVTRRLRIVGKIETKENVHIDVIKLKMNIIFSVNCDKLSHV